MQMRVRVRMRVYACKPARHPACLLCSRFVHTPVTRPEICTLVIIWDQPVFYLPMVYVCF